MRIAYVLLGLTLAGCSLDPERNLTNKLSDDLPKIAEEYQATGMPWEGAEFANLEPADVEDATPLIVASYREFEQKDLPSGAKKVDIQQVRALTEGGKTGEAASMIAPLNHAFDLALEASEKTAVDLKGDPDGGMFTVIGSTDGKLKSLADLVSIEAEIAAAQGKTQEMLDDLAAGFRIGAFCGQRQDALGVSVRAAANEEQLRSINYCQTVLASNVPALKALQSLLQNTEITGSFSEAVRGEAYQSIGTCRNTMNLRLGILGTDGAENSPFPGVHTYPRSPLMRTGLPDELGQRAEMAMVLKAWIEAEPAVEKDDVAGISDALQNAIANEHDSMARQDLSLFLEIIPAAATQYMDVQAKLASTEALGEALIYKNEHGHWPVSLSQLPDRWTDPYSGGPLRMVLRKSGSFRVYSVGHDKKDNGGTDLSELPKGSNDGPLGSVGDDIVAAYPKLADAWRH